MFHYTRGSFQSVLAGHAPADPGRGLCGGAHPAAAELAGCHQPGWALGRPGLGAVQMQLLPEATPSAPPQQARAARGVVRFYGFCHVCHVCLIFQDDLPRLVSMLGDVPSLSSCVISWCRFRDFVVIFSLGRWCKESQFQRSDCSIFQLRTGQKRSAPRRMAGIFESEQTCTEPSHSGNQCRKDL